MDIDNKDKENSIMDIPFYDMKKAMSEKSKALYSDKNNIKRKWLKHYRELSVDNATIDNQNLIREIFNLVHTIFLINIESFMEEHKPLKTTYEEKSRKGKKWKEWKEKEYDFNGSKVTIKKGYENQFFDCARIIEDIGYDLGERKFDKVRLLRNLDEHNSLTVYEGNIVLSYEMAKEAMLALADVLIKMGVLDEKYGEPSIEDILVKKGDIVWDNYEIKELIGEGGSSRVYESVHSRLQKKLAIKEIKPGNYCSDLIKNECNNLISLNHSQIPRIYDTFSRHNIYYIVMDYIDGITLEEFIAQQDVLLEDKIKMLISICDIFQYLHSRANMVYVDLKPQNIIIGDDNVPYLVDFGISTNKGTLDVMAGTLGYTAPEIYKGDVDKRSDIYSLGCVLAYLVQNDDISRELDLIIKKCVEKNKEDRYSSVKELKEALLENINGNIVNKEVKEPNIQDVHYEEIKNIEYQSNIATTAGDSRNTYTTTNTFLSNEISSDTSKTEVREMTLKESIINPENTVILPREVIYQEDKKDNKSIKIKMVIIALIVTGVIFTFVMCLSGLLGNESGQKDPLAGQDKSTYEEDSNIDSTNPSESYDQSETQTEDTINPSESYEQNEVTTGDSTNEGTSNVMPSYENMVRNPDKYKDTVLTYKKPVSVVSYAATSTKLTFSIEDGDGQRIHCVLNDSSVLPQRLIDGDVVKITGKLTGVKENALGNAYLEMTISTLEFEEMYGTDDGPTYENMIRNPEKYKDTVLTYKKSVSVVSYATTSTKLTFTIEDGAGQKINCIMNDSSVLPQRLMDGDVVKITGKLTGVKENALGNDYLEMTILTLEFDEMHGSDDSPTYENMIRNPEKYKDTVLTYKKSVSVVSYATTSTKLTFTIEDGAGQKIHCVLNDSSVLPQRLMDGDVVKITGKLTGVKENALGTDYLEMTILTLEFDKMYGTDEGPTYQNMIRNPEKYKDTVLTYTTTVRTVSYYETSAKVTFWIEDGAGKDIYCVMNDSSVLPQRLMSGDRVTIIGKLTGVRENALGSDYLEIVVSKIEY